MDSFFSTYYDAELFDGVGGEGNLGRPAITAKIWCPGKVWLEGDLLRWQRSAWKQLVPRREMLGHFLRLENCSKSPDRVLAFVRKWGVLGVRKVNPKSWPLFRLQSFLRINGERYMFTSPLWRPHKGDDSEPWMIYPELAKSISGLVGVIAEMRISQMSTGSKESWKLIREDLPPPPTRSRADLILSNWINRLMDLGGVRLGLELGPMNMGGKRQNLQIGFADTYGLFGPVALQLAMVASGEGKAKGVLICSHCSQPYIRAKRMPKASERNYCDTCEQNGAPKRDARRAYQAKKRT